MMADVWVSVEEAAEPEWFEVIRRLIDAPTIDVCPSCHQAALRFFYLRGDDDATSHGGMWVWCPACRRFMHLTAAVPDWWVDEADVAVEDLDPEPVWLDANWARLRIGRDVP
jgi:hypothetical protein